MVPPKVKLSILASCIPARALTLFFLAVLGMEPGDSSMLGKCLDSEQPQLRASGLIGAFPDAASVVSAGAATRRLALPTLHSASPVNGVLSVPHGSGSFVTSVLSLSCHLIRKAEPSPPGSYIVLISPETAMTPSDRMKRVEGAFCPLHGWHGRAGGSLSCLTGNNGDSS